MISDKVRPHHLPRKAILYVRQSSAHQILHNRESSALRYAMLDRLMALSSNVPTGQHHGAPWRHAGRSDSVQALWPQAHSPVHRHKAPYPS
jgi:hypothetical protein